VRKYGLTVFENMMLRKKFGPKREMCEKNGKKYVT
jgi:hypothetical protein